MTLKTFSGLIRHNSLVTLGFTLATLVIDPLSLYATFVSLSLSGPYFLFPYYRMSEQVIKVTTTIDVSFSDLTNRMTKKKATAIWNFLLSISKRRHLRYTVSASQYDFVRDVIVDAAILETPINTSDSDSDSTFSG